MSLCPMKKRVCIVGCGAISPLHLESIKKIDNCELVAVCDNNKERADKAATKYNVRAIYNFDEAVSDEAIDALHICTPHYLHVEMTVKALEIGKYVVLEKPFAIDSDGLQKLVEADEKHSGKLCVILQNRLNPCVKMLKEIIDEKGRENILGINAFMTWCRDEKYYSQDAWRGKWSTEGGGVIINQAVHLIDLIDYLSSGIEKLKCNISNKSLQGIIEVEDTADALLYLKNGTRATFYSTNAYKLNNPIQLVVNFKDVAYRYADNFLYEIKNNEMPKVLIGDNMEINGKPCWGNSHIDVINNFYNSIKTGGKDYISLKNAVTSAKILLAMYESGKNDGIEVEI